MTTFQERMEFLSASSAAILSKLSELSHLREQVKQAQAAGLNPSKANSNVRGKTMSSDKSGGLSLILSANTVQIRGSKK
jgi:hypothetical protein